MINMCYKKDKFLTIVSQSVEDRDNFIQDEHYTTLKEVRKL